MPEDEKTEEASQRRIDQAREKGDVPKSRELNSAIALLLGWLTLRFFAQFSKASSETGAGPPFAMFRLNLGSILGACGPAF